MFNISFSELIVILILSFLILGPAGMSKVARFFGKAVREARKYLSAIKEYVNDETGADDIEEVVSDVEKDLKDIKKDIPDTNSQASLEKILTEKKK